MLLVSGSLASRSSLVKPVNTMESVSTGLNLTSADGTKRSSSSVGGLLSPSVVKRGITRSLATAGLRSSNSKLRSFSEELTNCKITRIME